MSQLPPPQAKKTKESLANPATTSLTTTETAPQIKTRHAPPQPPQSYRDPVNSDSKDISENNCDSLTQLSLVSSTSSQAQVKTTLANALSQNFFAGLESSQDSHPMETDNLTVSTPNQHANKRKRADTNPDDQGTPSPAMRSTNSQMNNPLPPNQLGLSTSSHNQTPPSSRNSPAGENNAQLSRLSLGSNLSTAALQNNSVPSPRRQAQPSQSPYPSSQPPRSHQTPSINTNVTNLKITGFLGDNPLIGINPSSAAGWNSIGDLKALIYPHDASFSEDEKGIIAEQMVLAIAAHLNCHHRPVVTAPKQAKGFKKRKPGNRRPWVYMVSALSEENLDILLHDCFISNQHTSLHNLTYDPDRQSSVVNLIQRSIDSDPTVKSFINEFLRAHNDNTPCSVMRRSYPTDWIISTVQAFPIQSEGKHSRPYSQWNWYIFTPIRIQEHVETWIKTLATVQFNAIAPGVGETVTNLKCTRCKSTNHVDSECFFTGRTPYVPTPLAPPNNAPSSLRGGRGGRRGNTRGKGGGGLPNN
ncbi:hypothetical protein BJ322DRAFT_1022947 [Thelephora terrestris]|uniref:Uncharacterized protein n=1 Tax=Thelephora terrestris TaxID=56493 RepID=A0A9P6H8R5_9AGAM|nr:hypothetical protein BJ322DRAFT_1022947 [Thelephora terrestris]